MDFQDSSVRASAYTYPTVRILFTSIGYKPAWKLGGPVPVLVAIAEELARRGHEVWVAATDSNLTERLEVDTSRWHEMEGVRVRYFPMVDPPYRRIPHASFRRSNGEYAAPELRQWLNGEHKPFDIVHSHLGFLYANRHAAAYCRKTGTPYVYQAHGVFDPVRLRHRPFRKWLALTLWEKRACATASTLVALTEYEAQSYRRLGLRNPIEVIPNGVDLPPAVEKGDGPLTCLFLSRLHPLKGVDALVEAAGIVAREDPTIRFLVAGPDEAGIEDELRKRSAECGANVQFLGTVAGEKKERLLHDSHLFLLATESEGFSIAILEALAHGCGVLTTPGAHFPELEPTGAGRILAKDPRAFADTILALAADRDRVRAMGRAARNLVEQRYSWDRVVDLYEDLYSRLVSPVEPNREVRR